jgi:transposase InsO family protein
VIVASGTRALTPAGRPPETIIVGAGIAGLACARRLDEVQHPYLMITENVGGRIRRSGDGAVNLGAYYVRADYRHVAQLVERGRRINSLAVRRHDQAGSYTLWNHRLLLHLPQAARFLRQLRTFRSHYRLVAEHPDHVWALDYQSDVTASGRTSKILHVVDEHTRESLADLVAYSIDADATVGVLDKVVGHRGRPPEFIRCDNGPELTANALRDWCRFTGAGTSYIDPGAPWQNPWVESYGSRMRDELLAIETFDTLLEAQVLVADWRKEYNSYRPHSALGMLTPNEYARQWLTTNPNSHNGWTNNRGPVSAAGFCSVALWGSLPFAEVTRYHQRFGKRKSCVWAARSQHTERAPRRRGHPSPRRRWRRGLRYLDVGNPCRGSSNCRSLIQHNP